MWLLKFVRTLGWHQSQTLNKNSSSTGDWTSTTSLNTSSKHHVLNRVVLGQGLMWNVRSLKSTRSQHLNKVDKELIKNQKSVKLSLLIMIFFSVYKINILVLEHKNILARPYFQYSGKYFKLLYKSVTFKITEGL